MARLLAFNVIFFALPFVVYAAWLYATRGSANQAADWPTKVIAYLAIGGAILMILSLVVFVSFNGGLPGDTYVPAHLEGGTIVPGRFE